MSFAVTKTYDDGTDLTEAQLDTAFGSIETLINTTGMAAENIQSSAITAAKIDTGAVTTAKIDSAAVTLAKLAAEVSAFLLPTGTILPYGGTSAPTGFLLCNGAAVSRATYSALFGVIAETAGEGDNSTTFNVPDLRGRFLRGTDGGTGRDPNAATRTAMGTGGNTGDNIFSLQDDEFESHTHTATVTDPTHTHNAGAVASNTLVGTGGNALSYTGGYNTSPVQAAATGVTVSNSSTGGSTETRPKNANVTYIIKT